MLPLVLTVPLALVGLDLVAPWPSALSVGVLPVLTPSGWTSEAALSRRLSQQYDCEQYDDPTQKHRCEWAEEMACTMGGDCDEDDEVHHMLAGLGAFMSIFFVLPFIACGSCIAQLIFMCQYKSIVTDRRPPLQPGAGAAQLSASGDFASGLCSCFDDCPICLHAYFCGPCRAGDTYHSADIMQYWSVIGLFWVANIVAFVITMIVNGLLNMMVPKVEHVVHEDETQKVTAETVHPAVAVINSIVPTIVGVLVLGGIFQKFRRQLRVKLGKTEEDQPNIVMDIILFGLCTCCAVSQEARAYDAATGVKVACCCNLTDVAGQPLNVQAQPLVGQPVPVQGRVM